MSQDLKIIKKKYGEKMAHLCREFFPTLLESEGLLLTLMLNNFEPNHDLYDDIINQKKEDEFKNYIYSLVDVENNNEIKVVKSPKELLDEAGYDLYECHSYKDIDKFIKYYAPGESLCTFMAERLERCYVFFAVKKNVDNIKRENFKNPQRQDEYGTSVISIQFTFSNNLDNIIPGLTASFGKFYGLVQQYPHSNFELDGYVQANDGKFYKYNQEINNIYFCPNNIIIDYFEVKRYAKEKYIVFDIFVIDLVNKKIEVYDKGFLFTLFDPKAIIKKIIIENLDNKEKEVRIILEDNSIKKLILNKYNQLLKFEEPDIKIMGNDLDSQSLFNDDNIITRKR